MGTKFAGIVFLTQKELDDLSISFGRRASKRFSFYSIDPAQETRLAVELELMKMSCTEREDTFIAEMNLPGTKAIFTMKIIVVSSHEQNIFSTICLTTENTEIA